MSKYTLQFLPSLSDIPKKDWDSLASTLPQPLIQYGFLKLLEDSRSVCPDTGWQPAHFTLRKEGRLIAAAPLYIRSHSWGEFVFDMAFAQVAEAQGWDYYPKLVGTLPLSPVPGWQIMCAPEVDPGEIWKIFDHSTREFCQTQGLKGRHLLWAAQEFLLGNFSGAGSPWDHQVYLWVNEGYATFEDFLNRFGKNQRRNIRREREKPHTQSLELRFENGKDLPSFYYEKMAWLYEKTNDQFGEMGAKYLTPDFFALLQEYAGELCWFSGAFSSHAESPVALALLVEKEGRAWGRYWGTEGDWDFLHFNLCYYHPLEQAILRGWKSFDPGMGGDHKTRRGFRSENAPSYHWSPDPRIQRLFEGNLPRFNGEEKLRISLMNNEIPFKP